MYPFFNDKTECVASLGETGLIEKIHVWLAGVTAPPPRGIGDDCAVLPAQPAAGMRLVTTDSVIWGGHIDESVLPEHGGEKLIKRNLSDIAACGGVPTDAVLSLILGPNLRIDWLERFFAGVAGACRTFNVELAGGDIVRAQPDFFCATLSLTGFAEKPLQRLTARAGDTILVTGTLGGSLAGKHYAFTPRLAEGRLLAAHPAIRAGMDITDGLGKDLRALLPPATRAVLDLEKLPVSDDARAMSARDNRSPADHVFNDGEDYELLLAADTGALPALLREWEKSFPATPLTPIGVIEKTSPENAGKFFDAAGKEIGNNFFGFSHF